jgi:FkbM family methyltransferase
LPGYWLDKRLKKLPLGEAMPMGTKLRNYEVYRIINKFDWLGKLYQRLGSSPLFRPLIHRIREIDDRRYRKQRLEFYSQFMEKGDVVFDIGANIGNRTDIFLSLGCFVVAVEPQKECIEYLRKKFRSEKNVVFIDKAIDEKVQTKQLYICGSDASSSLSSEWISTLKKGKFRNLEWQQSVTVSTTTLDELIKEYGVPAFCKIDVEGYELNTLKGLSQPIPSISFEFTVELPEQAEKCIQHLSLLGKPIFNYSFGESLEMEFERWVTAPEMIMVLNKLPDLSQGDIYVRFAK